MTFGNALDDCRRHLRYLRAAAGRISWPLTADRMTAPDDELVAADFFAADRLPRLPPHGTIARRLIERSLAGEG